MAIRILLIRFWIGVVGGFTLENLPAKERWGSTSLLQHAEANSRIVAVESIADLPCGLMCDLIISNHALEHITDPFSVLCELGKRFTNNGTIVSSHRWMNDLANRIPKRLA